MIQDDSELPSEMIFEKTDEELAEALSGHRGNWFSWWRVGLSLITLTAVVVMFQAITGTGRTYFNLMGGDGPLSYSYYDEAENQKAIIKQEKRNRWESDPDNKGYFMDYVISESSGDGNVTEEILKEAQRVDPENSYYYYAAAANHFGGYPETPFVKKVEDESSDWIEDEDENDEIGKVQEWEVTDREKYDEALNYIKEGGKRQGIIDHALDQRLSYLDNYRVMKEAGEMDWIEQSYAVAEMFTGEIYSMDWVNLANIFDTKFYELSKEGSVEEVSFWIAEHEKFVDAIFLEEGTLIDYLVVRAVIESSLPNMREAAARVGLDDEVKKFTAGIEKTKKERSELKAQRNASEVNREISRKTSYSRDSYFMYMAGRVVVKHAREQDKIDIPSLKEGRLADHALAGRLFSVTCFWSLALGMIGMWIFFFAKRKKIRMMSMQSLGALTMMDGVLVMFGGVLFPVVMYIIINEHTALGVREWSVLAESLVLVVIQFVGMLMTVLSLSMALLHWRLSVRLPSLISRGWVLGWVLPVLSFASVILVGMSDSWSEDLPWSIAGMLTSLALLGWVLMVSVSAFREKDELAKVAMCRGMLSVYASLLVVFVGLYHYYHAQEKAMIAASEEITFKKEHLGLMTIEYRTAQQMRKELEERLDIIR